MLVLIAAWLLVTWGRVLDSPFDIRDELVTTTTHTRYVVATPREHVVGETLACRQAAPVWIAVDTANVYWTNFGTTDTDGAIMMVPK
jgi:hypothetical protein